MLTLQCVSDSANEMNNGDVVLLKSTLLCPSMDIEFRLEEDSGWGRFHLVCFHAAYLYNFMHQPLDWWRSDPK